MNLFELLYVKTPASLRFIYLPIQNIRYLRINKWLLAGLEPNTKQELAILFVGNETNMHYLADLAFSGHCKISYLGKIWFFLIPRISHAKNSKWSIFVAAIPNLLIHVDNSFCIPSWIQGNINITENLQEIIKKHKTLQTDQRRIKTNLLSFEVTNDESKLHDFYYTMYLPYINKRFRNPLVTKYQTLKGQFPNYELILIKSKDKEIGGGIITYAGHEPHLLLLGVKDGDPQYVKIGFFGALYYFTLEYLREKGFQKVDVGLSRPFLKDSALNYKKRWGLKINGHENLCFMLSLLKTTDGSNAFLTNNPFIYMNGGEYDCAVLMDDNKPIDDTIMTNITEKYLFAGISKINIFNTKENDLILVKQISQQENVN